eukprot:TRINITY_DN14639_c0_g1_i1.p1 TRINITY_DN14639_c0_g1~~TRINITY_DN14639_c0_g1_i1.p1  ORF type:complete len:298 (-),score=36.28 TRINITY_DN14639_c0_g1_i1:48-941(-)
MGRWQPSEELLREHNDKKGTLFQQYKLYHRSKTPLYLLDNPYIINGYRVNFPIPLCLYSVFRLHNETGNIWTHLISFIGFLALTFYTHLYYLSYPQDGFLDQLLFFVFLTSALVCFLFSSIYHAVICNSFRTCMSWAFLDFSGINLLICCSWMLLTNLLMKCHPVWQNVYLVGLTTFLIVKLFLPRLGTRTHFARIIAFGAMACFGVIPITHWIILLGVDHPLVISIVWMFPFCWLIYAVGMVLYITRYPEKWAPGCFDYWLHSHQWWHVFVALGTLWFYWINVRLTNYHRANECDL